MNTESKLERLIPALDAYMLAKLKIQQFRFKKYLVPKELLEECDNLADQLTEEWCSINPDWMTTS